MFIMMTMNSHALFVSFLWVLDLTELIVSVLDIMAVSVILSYAHADFTSSICYWWYVLLF